MSREAILERLGQVVQESSADEIDWSTVTDGTTFASFGFDSIAVLDLIFDVEQEFGVQIAAEEILGKKTIGDLVTFLESDAD